MSPEGTVKVEHIWKRFRVDRGRRLLRDHLGRGKQLLTRSEAGANPWRWVLRDVSFELEPGESVGIVGANGAGKSTLFKIISGLMFPHTGSITNPVAVDRDEDRLPARLMEPQPVGPVVGRVRLLAPLVGGRADQRVGDLGDRGDVIEARGADGHRHERRVRGRHRT